ncbi:MAG: extracellular solute-binding protein [Treponema sp.]|jgi:putative aldouronate transport system substrate-binding protein|nr:extracellular solute-binding protein [Treponema sp.]
MFPNGKMKAPRAFWAAAALLAAAIAGAALPGCRKSGPPAVGATGKPVSITVEVYDRGTDSGKSNPADNNWTSWIKEKVLKDENIDVTFVPVNRWDETTAMNNLMASGTAPDLCYTYNWDMVNSFGLQGGVYDLAPYVDTLLTDLKAFLGPDPQIPGRDFIWRSQNQDNDALYGISNRYMYSASYNLFIRKDWLDTLGLGLPGTPQEYYDALTAFKEKDPGKVGKNRVVPFTMSTDVRWAAGIILESFIDPSISFRERWTTTIVERYALTPGYKEGMRFLNKMYNAGLIDPDFPLYKADDLLTNLIKSGVVGSIAGNWDQPYRDNVSLLVDLQKNVPGALFVPIDSFPSADGVTHKRGAPVAGGLTIFVPKTSQKLEAALRYVNWLAREENLRFLQFGTEGVNHQMVNGIPRAVSETGLWIMNSAANVDYTPFVNGYAMETPDLTARVLAASYPSWPEDVIAEAYRISSFNAEPAPVVTVTLYKAGPLTETLVSKSSAFYIESICARPENFDKAWDAGIKDWLVSGAQEVLDERRTKYNGPE